MKWRVWITGYPGSYTEIEEGAFKGVSNAEAAMRYAAPTFKAQHTGEIVEINAFRVDLDDSVIHRKFVRLSSGGGFEIAQ
jgi:hypothetical protein